MPGILKDAAYPLSSPLTYLINLLSSTGLVPTNWQVAKVTPIHKGGTTDDNNNFRPISVLTTCSKILERAVHKQLIEHLESNDLSSENKFGYRKQRSTELATVLLTDNILSHSVLLEKLKSLGINESVHMWFSNYLFNRKEYCVIKKCTSESINIACGVPQGSVLGPLLFLIYFNDFEKFLQYSQALNFADDTVVYVTGKCKDMIKYQLNKDLKLMTTYF